MSWKVRHAGSPKFRDNLTVQQVAQGLADGHWDQTDEVMGPGDQQWIPFEEHPTFEEIVEDLEPPEPADHSDETTIDMNALIDVCLVLLIFFMLTMTYSQLQKAMTAPKVSKDDSGPKTIVVDPKTQETMIIVTLDIDKKTKELNLHVQGTKVKLKDPKKVTQEDLAEVLKSNGAGTEKVKMVQQVAFDVPHGSAAAIRDAAKSAGIETIYMAKPQKE